MTVAPIAALLAPISEDAPFGTYLKADRALYRALRNRFNAAQTAYRALSETVESLADRELQMQNREAWQALSDEAQTVLTAQSRDLELLCWYIAAQIHLETPLTRLLAAVLTVTELVETSWDQLQPLPPADKLKAADESGQAKEIDALRLRSFVQLVGEVPGSGLLHLPLTNLVLVGRTTLGNFLAAERDGAIAALKAEVAAEIADESAILRDRVLQLGDLQSALDRLDIALRAAAARSGEPPVQVARLAKQVADLLRALLVLTEGTAFVWPIVETDQPKADDADDLAPAEAALGHGAARQMTGADASLSRETALSNLEALIAHFRITEPHSPVHTLLARGLRWARMPLPDVMSEVLGADSEAMARLSMMAGLESAGERLARPVTMVAPVAVSVTPPERAETGIQTPDDAPQQDVVQESNPPPEGKITSFEW